MRKIPFWAWPRPMRRAYAWAMAIGRRDRDRRYKPVPVPPGLAKYEGLWIAVLNGSVVAAAPTTRELVRVLAEAGPKVRGATMQRVPGPEQGLLVGMG